MYIVQAPRYHRMLDTRPKYILYVNIISKIILPNVDYFFANFLPILKVNFPDEQECQNSAIDWLCPNLFQIKVIVLGQCN